MDEPVIWEGLACPLPISMRDTVVLGHGSGGRMSQDLIAGLFYPAFDNPVLREAGDASVGEQDRNIAVGEKYPACRRSQPSC